ncbi:MAG: ribosomal RNA small subunit methyltransferase A [Candidatus Omnitrophica bacterium]|nr:ribosomal RNA small subunit methyltransferase A [Candidatus Omnitrophota bacterium]
MNWPFYKFVTVRNPSSAAFFPKKSLGQNFLVNPHFQQKIIEACELRPEDVVLEIGPGKGVLTRPLADSVKKVLAIEKDNFLAPQLEEEFAGTNVTIEHADVLKYPFEPLPGPMKVVGNLPYNIATPIIEKVLAFRHKFPVFYMTVQLEYGDRIVAKPGSKKYGSLSCFVQYYADVQKLFNIPPSAFSPAPKVDSCFLSLHMRPKPVHPAHDEEFLFMLIRACFSQRRKTIRNSLAAVYGKEDTGKLLEKLKIDPRMRAEDLSLEDYVRLANQNASKLPF